MEEEAGMGWDGMGGVLWVIIDPEEGEKQRPRILGCMYIHTSWLNE